MEDMARLALVEQSVGDVETFGKVLYALLRHISQILENPHDYELRTIRSETVKKFLQYEALSDYLKSIGFRTTDDEYTYPKECTLSNLRMAQAAIERKIYFCCGPVKQEWQVKSVHNLPHMEPPKLTPVKVLNTTNPLLLKLEALFNEVLQYEDEELQALAREHIPLVTLQLMALDLMREHQKKIKTGETTQPDMSFDVALLHVLVGWFKHRFFTWVDAPACTVCGGDTAHTGNEVVNSEGETCRLEVYKCLECGSRAEFPRYNRARTLLRTRRGRCGEWASCFGLLARALGYDTRIVHCTTDHVWCEVWDYSSLSWLHVDPCEAAVGAPLLYARGWGKRLEHVLAASRDDLQDVTWRYTQGHPEVLKRRTDCSEAELMNAIMTLRAERQKQVSEGRRRFLTRRALLELADMLTEPKVTDQELSGRVSGAAAWRRARGETGVTVTPRVHRYLRPGLCQLAYHVTTDRYEVVGGSEAELQGWASGVYSAEHMFRKVEKDWKMVYLAREEDSAAGSISWVIESEEGTEFTSLCVRATTAVFEAGVISWTVRFDGQPPEPADISERATQWSCHFRRAELSARLLGPHWQHAQLFRTPLALQPPAPPAPPALLIQATLQETL